MKKDEDEEWPDTEARRETDAREKGCLIAVGIGLLYALYRLLQKYW